MSSETMASPPPPETPTRRPSRRQTLVPASFASPSLVEDSSRTPSNETATRRTRGSRSSTVTSVSSQVTFDNLPPNVRLPPRPSDYPDDVSSSSRESSPSRISNFADRNARKNSLLHGEPRPLQRSETAPRPRPSSTTLFAMFKGQDAGPAVAKKRPVSLFNFKFGAGGAVPATSPSRNTPTSTDIIDEFAGLSFPALLTPYLTEPTDPPESPADALLRTPEARLEAAVETATTLLTRLYSAYLQRTDSLCDLHTELDVTKQTLASEARLVASLQSTNSKQNDILDSEAAAHSAELADLQQQLATERRRREAAEEEIRIIKRRSNPASDSGFESDVDSASMFSRSSVVSPVEEKDEGSSIRIHLEAPPSAKNPTPLREAWSPDNQSGGGVWGFFKGKQQQAWKGSQDVDTVRAENRWLRSRVGELEGCVEAALEAVAGRSR